MECSVTHWAMSLVSFRCPACMQFLSLDLRNGALRKKYDALKYTLKKMEVRLLGCFALLLMSKASALPSDIN